MMLFLVMSFLMGSITSHLCTNPLASGAFLGVTATEKYAPKVRDVSL